MAQINKLDLRIGNIIGNHKGEPFEVNTDTIARFEQCEIIFGKFKPIYMSNKWALKFGFDDLKEMALMTRIETKYPIELEASDIKSLRVYEAQNLYRFLTGKELKI